MTTEQKSVYAALGRVRWARMLVVVLALLLAVGAWPAPAHAADSVTLPTVKNFSAARFDVLVSVSVNGVTDFLFGKGAVQLPGKLQAWLGTNQTSVRTGVVQVGSAIYINTGSGWQRSQDVMLGGIQALPVAEQLQQLAAIADGIYRIGDVPVRGKAATQYQVQVSGAKVLQLIGDVSGLDDTTRELVSQLSYKYDFWIGPDGTLYQQNSFVSIPETTINGQAIPAISYNSLVTYYDFDDQTINVVAPI